MLAPWLPSRIAAWQAREDMVVSAQRRPCAASSRVSRLSHRAPTPQSWDSEVVGWVVQKVWLNQNNVFVGILRAQRFKHAPSDDASIFTLCTIFSESGHA